jgi:hypothetical protein
VGELVEGYLNGRKNILEGRGACHWKLNLDYIRWDLQKIGVVVALKMACCDPSVPEQRREAPGPVRCSRRMMKTAASLAVVAIRCDPDAAAWALAQFHPSLRPTRATTVRAPRACPASAVNPLGTFDSRSQGLPEQEQRGSARSIVKQTVELNSGGYQKRTALWEDFGREVRSDGRANVPLIPGAV